MKREGQGPAGQRLAVVADEHGLDAAQAARLLDFITLLERDPHAPTAVREAARGVDVHLADSLVALPYIDDAVAAGPSNRIADLGTGAGLPGIPLAVARPWLEFDLVEATRRKCGFLEQAIEALGIANADVICARAEELPARGRREEYGAVVVRAVAPLATLAEYASPLLALGGHLLAWKGLPEPGEEAAGAKAAAQVGLELAGVHPVTPYAGSRNRHLYLYRKVSPCPARFPRRPGVAHRRPLA